MTDAENQDNQSDIKSSAPENADNSGGENKQVVENKSADTILDDIGGDETKAKEAPADYPQDWREKYAGDDKSRLGQLKRFTSPKTAMDAYFSLRQKISSGEYKSALPKDAKPEEVTRWREENGIPEAPEKYDTELGDGLVIGENDKPLVNEVLKSMHAVNASNDQVKAVLGTYFKIQQQKGDALADADADRWKATEDALRSEMGNEYRANQGLITGLINLAPLEVRNMIATARMQDGSRIGDNLATVKWLAEIAREINPVSTLVPGADKNNAAVLEEEITGIEKLMGDYTSDYWKGPKSAGLQKKYTDLITARDKIKSRAA